MKSIFKHRYLVSALGLALMGSASAATIEITSAEQGIGDGTGCTLTGAIESVRTGQDANGCHNMVNEGYGSNDLVWADISKVAYHLLEKTQVIDFPITINVTAKFDKNIGEVVDDLSTLNSVYRPLITVEKDNRHFEILKTQGVVLKGMTFYGAYISPVEDMLPLGTKDTPEAAMERKLQRSGGAVLVHSGADATFDHVRFARNTVGVAVVCFDFGTNNPGNSGYNIDHIEGFGSALSVIQANATIQESEFKANLFGPFSSTKPCGDDFWNQPGDYLNSTGTVYLLDSNVNVSRTRFINNSAQTGSALAAYSSSLTMTHNEILSNFYEVALNGQHYYGYQSVVDLKYSDATMSFQNISNNYGIGLMILGGTGINVKQSTISGNALHAIVNSYGKLNVDNALIEGNLVRPSPYQDIGKLPNSAIANMDFDSPLPLDDQYASFISLLHVTVADNFSDFAIYSGNQSQTNIQASILYHTQTPTTCSSPDPTKVYVSGGANIDNNDDTCGLKNINDAFATNPNLSGVSIFSVLGMDMPINKPAVNSPALQREAVCSVKEDQVGNLRPSDSCDSGAIEIP